MSSAARGERRRAARAERKQRRREPCFPLDDEWGVQVGWCKTEADLPEARSETHDKLIRLMGARRTGGVRWAWYEGDEAGAKLDALVEGELRSEFLDMYRHIRALIREHGGYLVIAMAPGVAP